jgi:tetratricopeptide (TPR) repeat protein
MLKTILPLLLLVGLAAPAQAAKLGNTSQATLDLARAHAAGAPQSADAQFDLAMAYARTPFLEHGWDALGRVTALDGNYAAKVVDRCESDLVAEPNDLEARFRLAFGYYFRGDREAARRELERLVAIAPEDAWFHDYLGFVQAEGDRLDLATASWNRALQLDPNNAVTHYLLGQVHYRQGRFVQAAAELAQALKLRAASPLKP